jgi:hypothetical protein
MFLKTWCGALAAVACTIVIGGRPAAASAAPVIDVDNLVLEPAGTTGWNGLAVFSFIGNQQAQDWTVGVSGTLARIDLFTDAYGPAFDAILSVYGGASTIHEMGTVFLGSATVASTSLPGAVAPDVASWDFSALNIHADAGDILTFVMTPAFTCSATCAQGWDDVYAFQPSGASASGYTGGDTFGISPALGQFVQGASFNFRTWMTPPGAVPEPGEWTMLLVGLGSLGALARRRRACP